MADFNKILTPGDYENGELNVVIEIPTGSNHKIEWIVSTLVLCLTA